MKRRSKSSGRPSQKEGERFHLDVSVRPYRDPKSALAPQRRNIYFLTVTGHDRKGIVPEITSSFAGPFSPVCTQSASIFV